MVLLRFSDGRGHTKEFQSSLPLAKDCIEAAFQHFHRDVCGRRALFEVHHPYLGWRSIYNPQGEFIYLNDPCCVDVNALARAVSFTLAVLSHTPSIAEQRAKRVHLASQVRAEQALLRRSQFKLLSSAQ